MLIRNVALSAAVAFVPAAAFAQTDYFNTDRGRPLQVQDAIPIERYAFELQAAPLRWSRTAGANGVWSVEPELAYGVLPRTQLEIGVPLLHVDGSVTGAGALHVSVLHALNVETLGIPALAVSAGYSGPTGPFGPPDAYATFGLLATRTTSLGRLHVNADASLVDEIAATDEVWNTPRAAGLDHVSRWLVGVAGDRTFPLRSMLVGVELFARQPILAGSEVEWTAGAGLRWQLDPWWALDAGLGRTFGDDREWSLTFGAARSFGILKLFPLGR